MGTRKSFNPVALLGSKESHSERSPKALMLTKASTYVFDAEVTIQKNNDGLDVNVSTPGWEKEA